MRLILLGIIFQQQFQYINSNPIKQDSGVTIFNKPTFYNAQDSQTNTISFLGTFANIPKIILVADQLDLIYSGVIFQLQTQNITTSGFEIYMLCVSGQVFSLVYHWYAFDSSLVEVINQFNIVEYSSKSFSHQNPSATKAFTSILSVGFSGLFEFEVQIFAINKTHVTIQITDPSQLNTNLKILGYQIILVVPEIYNLVDTVTSTTNFTSASIPVKPQSFFMLPQSYLKRQNLLHNVRYNISYLTTDPISYSRYNWFGDYLINKMLQIQLFTPPSSPLFCNHFEAIQNIQDDPSLGLTPSVQMLILETNQQFASIGKYITYLEKRFSSVNFEIKVNCLSTKNAQSSFYIYISQTGQIQQTQYQHSCSSQYHILTYYSRFKQQASNVDEELQIIITSDSLTINQIIYDQLEIQYFQLTTIQIIEQ